MNKKTVLYIMLLMLICSKISAQLLLEADGPGNTYEEIRAHLAPGYEPIEPPDCNHLSFGRHIDEVFDADLNDYAFRFHIHVAEDDDRCINFDRQRNEIKTYDQSPDNLLGVVGEVFVYKWKFKLDAGFQSSSKFTHIHQLKAVGGTQSSMPLITLTTRKGTPDKLQLRYSDSITQVTIHQVDLTAFKGEWVEATETVTYGETGNYHILIERLSDNAILMDYNDNTLRMWRDNADFVRPKWGIYRSLLESWDLRDEAVLFADFFIDENPETLPVELVYFKGKAKGNSSLLYWRTASETNNREFVIERSGNSLEWHSIGTTPGNHYSLQPISYRFEDTSPINGMNYYRLKQMDIDGTFEYSTVVNIEHDFLSDIQVFPNPAKTKICLFGITDAFDFELFNENGTLVHSGKSVNGDIDVKNLSDGMYWLKIIVDGKEFVQKILKF